MRQLLLAGAAALALAGCGDTAGEANNASTASNTAAAQPTGTIAESLGNSRLGAVVKAAGLDETLKGAGPYTLLAPSDEALAKLPAARVEALQKPEGKEELTRLLTHHVLPGTMLAADIGKAVDAGKGKAVLATMGGGTLTATRQGQQIVLTDAGGTRATMAGTERTVANGVIHPIDSVLVPSS